MSQLMDSNDWDFLAEGGANIIFKYTGVNPELVNFLNMYSIYVSGGKSCARPEEESQLRLKNDSICT